jgi:hypothetical protein
VKGDLKGPDGKFLTEEVELWRRDPIECIEELIGNPAFREYIAYAPELVYADDQGKTRIWDEMWNGDWWFKIQARDMTLRPVNAYLE